MSIGFLQLKRTRKKLASVGVAVKRQILDNQFSDLIKNTASVEHVKGVVKSPVSDAPFSSGKCFEAH